MVVNEKPVIIDLQQEHLLIQADQIHTGRNEVTIQLLQEMHRSIAIVITCMRCLYPTTPIPYFPASNQPDLKARFLLTLQVPAGWQVLQMQPPKIQ